MKLYAVIGGIDYEGESFDSLRLFDCKSAAEAYKEELVQSQGYDYAEMKMQEVCMQSAIAA